MVFSHSIGNRRYTFGCLRELLAKATPLRSGDVLAGVAAQNAEERVAAQCALADVALAHFLDEANLLAEALRSLLTTVRPLAVVLTVVIGCFLDDDEMACCVCVLAPPTARRPSRDHVH